MRVLLLFIVVGLSACGFHLRGSDVSSTFAGAVYLSDNSSGLVSVDLRRSLDRQGALVDTLTDTSLEVVVDREERTRETISVGSDIRPREIELTYSVRLSFRRDPEQEFSSETLNTVDVFRFEVAGVLGNDNEEEVLYEEMRRELVRRLRQRLAALTRDDNS